MNIKYVLETVVFIFAALLFICPVNAEGSTILQIGKPDSSAFGFGLFGTGSHSYTDTFADGVVFTAGKDELDKWPFIHPSTLDAWAGSKVHTHTINFSVEQIRQKELYLHIGFAETHRWELSDLEAVLNKVSLVSQKVPAGSSRSDPWAKGKPSSLTFTIAVDQIKTGTNTLALTLDNGSWVIYDYVSITGDKNPPALTPRPSLAMFLQQKLKDVPVFNEIVFARRRIGPDYHWYANFGYYADARVPGSFSASTSRKLVVPGGQLCKLNLTTGEVTVLIDEKLGAVRDPVVHY
ncbi:MAG: hypothetical protein GY799_34550, partial [Desulfobulbaceae bacterium]|nr:hypothetical protein [Desulfobulbaceae bacterium]